MSADSQQQSQQDAQSQSQPLSQSQGQSRPTSIRPELIVSKFGGTSLANAEQVKRVIDIIRKDPRRTCIVVSAPGKRHANDSKITDLLLDDWTKKNALPRPQVPTHKEVVFGRFDEIVKGLGLTDFDLRTEFDRCFAEGMASTGMPDLMISRGEYLMAKILATALGYRFIDASACIAIDMAGKPDLKKSYGLINMLTGYHNVVIPGFYGLACDEDSASRSEIKTFSRGGSDITGAIAAAALGACLYENWTDVNGLCMADPRIVEHSRKIPHATYRELREMTYMGANVFQEEAMFPVQEAGIPTIIRNTNYPDLDGTMITVAASQDRCHEWTITGIAGKKYFTVFAIEKKRMNDEIGFASKVLEVFARKSISVEHMPSSVDSVSVIVDNTKFDQPSGGIPHGRLERQIASVAASIYEDAEIRVDSIVTYPMAMIAVVGIGMVCRIGALAQASRALADARVNIRMVNQGSSELNIIFGVEPDDYEKAIRALYAAFVRR